MANAYEHDTGVNRAHRPRVLMLTHRVPCPPDRGDRIRAYHLLRAMSKRFDVTLASIADEPVSERTREELAGLTSDVLIAPAGPMRRRASAARALFTGQAITPAALMNRRLARRLADLHQRRPFDTVLTYCTGMIGYTQAIRRAGSPFRHVLDLVDVDSLKWSRYAQTTHGPMRLVYASEARRLRAVEAGRLVPFDAVTVISQHEADRYREAVDDRHAPVVVGNGVDLDRFCPAKGTHLEDPVLVFTGVMSYKPNIDAVAWFARRVMPRIRAAVPGVRFEIVGNSPAPAVTALGELPGVRVVGAVPNTAEYLQRSTVAVAPMWIAPGVQNKVLEAMACARPVVCTSAAAAGIDALAGQHLLIADSAADTASQCVRLLVNPSLCEQIGTAAREQMETRYRWPTALAPMLDLLEPARHFAMAPIA